MGTVKQVIENKRINACVMIIACSDNGHKSETEADAKARGKYVALTVKTYPSVLKGIMDVYFEIPKEWEERYLGVAFHVTGFSTPRIAPKGLPNKLEAHTNSDLGIINEKNVFLLVKHL